MGLTLTHGARIYLDANIIIYAAENTGNFGDRCRAVFRRVTPGDLTAFTSELSVVECWFSPSVPDTPRPAISTCGSSATRKR